MNTLLGDFRIAQIADNISCGLMYLWTNRYKNASYVVYDFLLSVGLPGHLSPFQNPVILTLELDYFLGGRSLSILNFALAIKQASVQTKS